MTKKIKRTPPLAAKSSEPWIIVDDIGEPFADCAGADRATFVESCANAQRILTAFEACRELILGNGTDESVQRTIDLARVALGLDAPGFRNSNARSTIPDAEGSPLSPSERERARALEAEQAGLRG
jgi:hypothetical protein